MRAMFIKEFGGPEVFEMRETEKPEPGANEVLVRVHATSVNPVDISIRQAGAWAGVKPPTIIGYDVSGVIEDVGSAVADLKVSEEVYYSPLISHKPGSYAEYHVADQKIVARKPEPLSHVQAATLPLVGMTAWDALVEKAHLRVGEAVLIHGCGGVGSIAVQLAKAAGAYVIVVSSDYMVETARELGADRAIDYKSEDFVDIVKDETDGFGVDVVLDTVGGDTLTRSIPITKPFGRMVGIVSNDSGFKSAFHKNIDVYPTFLQRTAYKLDALRVLVERGQIKPVIGAIMGLEALPEAHRKLSAGGVEGKIAIKIVGAPE